MEIVKDIIYKEGQCPLALPLAVVIEFKDYTEPIFLRFYKKSIPIVPLTSLALVDDQDMDRIHLPLKLWDNYNTQITRTNSTKRLD